MDPTPRTTTPMALETASPRESIADAAIPPLVSVIIPIYNGERDIPPLMDCLQAQTYPRDRVEYLLVDNHSTDHTAKRLKAAMAIANGTGFQFRYLSEVDIQSSYAARNRGVYEAQGEVLAFTDADCRPQPQWLADLVEPFGEPEVGWVVGDIIGAPGKTLLERFAIHTETLAQKHTLSHSFAPYGQTANLAVRRPVFDEVGLFRSYLTTGGDADFCWRIYRGTNWQLRSAPTAIVEHCHRSTWRELASQWRRYGRSNWYLHKLHGVPPMEPVELAQVMEGLFQWLPKDLPRTLRKVSQGEEPAIALIVYPTSLFCRWCRYQGQKHAQFDERAALIPRLGPQGIILEELAPTSATATRQTITAKGQSAKGQSAERVPH